MIVDTITENTKQYIDTFILKHFTKIQLLLIHSYIETKFKKCRYNISYTYIVCMYSSSYAFLGKSGLL